jgi:hypothetical protein
VSMARPSPARSAVSVWNLVLNHLLPMCIPSVGERCSPPGPTAPCRGPR